MRDIHDSCEDLKKVLDTEPLFKGSRMEESQVLKQRTSLIEQQRRTESSGKQKRGQEKDTVSE